MRRARKTGLAFILTSVIIFSVISICRAEKIDQVGAYLCEYAMKLYAQGNVSDAIRQLKMALAANPDNLRAKSYLSQIGGESPGQANVEVEVTGKDRELETISQQLSDHKELLKKKEEEVRSTLESNAAKIERLNQQLNQLEKEVAAYQQETGSLKNISLNQNRQLIQATEKLKTEKDLCLEGASQKEKDLTDLNRQIKNRNAQIVALSSRKSLLNENSQMRKGQLERIEKIMRDIEQAVPEAKEFAGKKPVLGKAERFQRINKLMREIEEILPKGEMEKLSLSGDEDVQE